MKSLRGLYAITDATLIPEQYFPETIELALKGGANIIQYRDKSEDHNKRLKQASEIKRLCEKYKSLFIINDDLQLVTKVNADGVHIGSHDTTLAAAREQLGRDKIIGVSCYNDFQLALDAQANGADYIAFGSFFSSTIKPDAQPAKLDLLHRAKLEITLPVCAIGGITRNNADSLIQSGADMLAVISDIFNNPRVEQAAQEFASLFEQRQD
ncbi:MAG: thiamine phosphate synthase [Gammaproteobacteria bacterium]|nr:thiamine phosphate synthase [Gammaproteobacteria bacterium]